MKPTIIVPVRVLEGEGIEQGVVELLANARVVLVGYHVLPEQTAPGQAREQFEERAQNRLTDIAEQFEGVGATVEKRMVFTQDSDQSIDRVAEEVDADATMVLNPATEMKDVLVAVRGDVILDRIVDVVGGLLHRTDISVTLLHVATPDSDIDGTALLDETSAVLQEAGVSDDRVESRIETSGTPLDRIAEIANNYDAIVLGESNPSVTTFLFGETSQKVAERFMLPVVRIRQPRDIEDADAEIAEAAEEATDDGEDEIDGEESE
ncbi:MULTISPECIES: universal stress protein [Natranaeroarchaeum]|uniref:Nucleotide-binding protein, UspA family n=2 Tax=Natranaeroarchaeum TaxID=2917705 RepID=A0A897MR37_9EURY|nr:MULTISPECIES: universal stress protein [Natranaeroarchaeum]MCL9815068.1 universal stress protein [Natranaeroarchaeum aerophilus]QSG02458.1 Nucleotide-binding protein, UspA family [Natranaeroarchaeum sulfidigenes]